MVKNLPAKWETWVQSLGWDDPLKKATSKPVFWPGQFHGQRNLTGYSPWGHRVRHDCVTFIYIYIYICMYIYVCVCISY